MDTIDDIILRAANSTSLKPLRTHKSRPLKDFTIAELYEFDETRAIVSDKIGSISISSSFVDIAIKPKLTRNIVAHLTGDIITEGTVNFDIYNDNNLLEIFVAVDGNIKITNSLSLKVEMPKRFLKNLSVSCNYSSLVISSHN